MKGPNQGLSESGSRSKNTTSFGEEAETDGRENGNYPPPVLRAIKRCRLAKPMESRCITRRRTPTGDSVNPSRGSARPGRRCESKT